MVRTEDELMALVHAKADHIRRRRRTHQALGAVIVTVVAVVGITVVALDGETPWTQVTAGDTYDDRATEPLERPAGEEQVPESAGLPDDEPPATSAPTPITPETAFPEPQLDTREEPRLCRRDEIDFVVTTDRSVYSVGEPVTVVAEAVNRAEHDCYPPVSNWTTIRDSRGEEVYSRGSTAARAPGTEWRWPSGERQRSELVWDQRRPGAYTATVTWTAEEVDTVTERVEYTAEAAFTVQP